MEVPSADHYFERLAPPIHSLSIWLDRFAEMYVEPGMGSRSLPSEAEFFLWELYGPIRDSLFLTAARLFDAPGSGPRRNLSLFALIEHPELQGHATADLKSRLQQARDDFQHIFDARNKAIGHWDLGAAFDEQRSHTASLRDFRELVTRVGDWYNDVASLVGLEAQSFQSVEGATHRLAQALSMFEEVGWWRRLEREAQDLRALRQAFNGSGASSETLEALTAFHPMLVGGEAS